MDLHPINWYSEPVPMWNFSFPPTFAPYHPPTTAPYYPPSPTLYYPPPTPPPHLSPSTILQIAITAAFQDCFAAMQQAFTDCNNKITSDIRKVQDKLHESSLTLGRLKESLSKLPTTATPANSGPLYAPEDPTLPSPWRGLIDRSSGSLYYWNPATNKTHYERPSQQPLQCHVLESEPPAIILEQPVVSLVSPEATIDDNVVPTITHTQSSLNPQQNSVMSHYISAYETNFTSGSTTHGSVVCGATTATTKSKLIQVSQLLKPRSRVKMKRKPWPQPARCRQTRERTGYRSLFLKVTEPNDLAVPIAVEYEFIVPETELSKGPELDLDELGADCCGLPILKPGLVVKDFALVHDIDHLLDDHTNSTIVHDFPQLLPAAANCSQNLCVNLPGRKISISVTIRPSCSHACDFRIHQLDSTSGHSEVIKSVEECLAFQIYFLIDLVGPKRTIRALVEFAQSEAALIHVLEVSRLHEWLLEHPVALFLVVQVEEKAYVERAAFEKLLPVPCIPSKLLSGSSYGIIGVLLMNGTLNDFISTSLLDFVCATRRNVILGVECGILLTDLNHILLPRCPLVRYATLNYPMFLEVVSIRKARYKLTQSGYWDLLVLRANNLERIPAVTLWKPSAIECYNVRAQTDPPPFSQFADSLCDGCYIFVLSYSDKSFVYVPTISIPRTTVEDPTTHELMNYVWVGTTMLCLLIPNPRSFLKVETIGFCQVNFEFLFLRTTIVTQYVVLLLFHILLCCTYDEKHSCRSTLASALLRKVTFFLGGSFTEVFQSTFTGYSRACRGRLLRKWGTMNVNACCLCASYLLESENVDRKRLCITVGSASGYTTTTALAFPETFNVGASLYGVVDLIMWRKETYSLESLYMEDYTIDHDHDLFDASSINLHVQFSWPMIFFHRLHDMIVLKILFLSYPSYKLLSRDNVVVLQIIIHSVGYVSQYMVFLATTFSVSYSPFQAPVRKLFPLSSMAAVQFLRPVLDQMWRVDCTIRVLVFNSINQLVSSTYKQQDLEIKSGDLYKENNGSHMRCSLYFIDIMTTWFIVFGFLAIDYGDLDLVPQKIFLIPMQSADTPLITILSTIGQSQSISTSHIMYYALWGLTLFIYDILNVVPCLGYFQSHYNSGLHLMLKPREAITVAIELCSNAIMGGLEAGKQSHVALCRAAMDGFADLASATIGGHTLSLQGKEAFTYIQIMSRHEMLPTPLLHAAIFRCCAVSPSSIPRTQSSDMVLGGFASNSAMMCLLLAGHEWTIGVVSSAISLSSIDVLAGQQLVEMLTGKTLTTPVSKSLMPFTTAECVVADIITKARHEKRKVSTEVLASFVIPLCFRHEDMPYFKGGGMLGLWCYNHLLCWAGMIIYLNGLVIGLGSGYIVNGHVGLVHLVVGRAM